jgi:hypothetical protein
MSYWKARAYVRDIPDDELRERLTDAIESLHYIAAALDEDDARPSNVDAMLQGIAWLKDDATEAKDQAEKAENRLEEELQSNASLDREELVKVTDERDAALERLAKVEPLIESYSDLLAIARRFTSVGDV